MEIKILGMGCIKCKLLFANVQQAVSELGLKATIKKVEDFIQIAQSGVMQTPALAIDGQIVLSGRLATTEEIKNLLCRNRKRISPSEDIQAKH